MLENTIGAIKNGQYRETGNIGYTRQLKTKQKQNTICVGHHYTQTITDNVNKTWVPLQTTGGKDEPNIVFTKNLENEQHEPHQKTGGEPRCSRRNLILKWINTCYLRNKISNIYKVKCMNITDNLLDIYPMKCLIFRW